MLKKILHKLSSAKKRIEHDLLVKSDKKFNALENLPPPSKNNSLSLINACYCLQSSFKLTFSKAK